MLDVGFRVEEFRDLVCRVEEILDDECGDFEGWGCKTPFDDESGDF